MDNSPSSYSTEEFEELEEAFEALYEELIKMVKWNIKLKDSLKKVFEEWSTRAKGDFYWKWSGLTPRGMDNQHKLEEGNDKVERRKYMASKGKGGLAHEW